MRRWLVLVWSLAEVCLAGSLGTISSADGQLTLAVTMEQPEDGIVHNRVTSLQVRVLPAIHDDGNPEAKTLQGGLEWEANMRDYRIGAILKPKVTELAPLHYSIDGVLLQIPGIWEIRFYLNVNENMVVFEKTISTVLPSSD